MRRSLGLVGGVTTLVLSGCELAGDIFQAGIWVGVVMVIGVIALLVWIFSRAKS